MSLSDGLKKAGLPAHLNNVIGKICQITFRGGDRVAAMTVANVQMTSTSLILAMVVNTDPDLVPVVGVQYCFELQGWFAYGPAGRSVTINLL